MPEHFTYKSYSWSLGTTSFRMADFHRKVEEQLRLLDAFWSIPGNANLRWVSNSRTQAQYYDYLFEEGFITGEIQDQPDKKSKTARQKTSGLVDIGLIDDNRRLTPVGSRLLSMTLSGDFSSDNEFQIPKDSFLYFKQLLKTSYEIENGYVRPYLVTGKVLLSCEGYLTDDEFTYLLPLCVDEDITDEIIEKIGSLRRGETSIDTIISETVLCRYNYPAALRYFINAQKTPENIMSIGMNRDGIRHDACYAELYAKLRNVYLEHDVHSVASLFEAARAIKNKPGTMWRGLLFNNPRRVNSFSDLAHNEFDNVQDETQFDRCFFRYLHLIKIKATLGDYKDLNRRYLSITDTVIFEDGKVSFSPLFENFFRTDAGNVFDDSFRNCLLLSSDCSLTDINEHLVFDGDEVVEAFNGEQGLELGTMQEVYDYIENERYRRFRTLIDTRFSNNTILTMLEKFESRDDDNYILNAVGSEADVPTIFEYIIGIAWYRMSGYRGRILEYMNLSLDVNLLPRTHAGGGESDIVYKYEQCEDYPQHALLIECTLMEGTVQRHGEMEPVSRHLANYLIDEDANAYCSFVSNNLHASVVSDFRMRKNSPYYRNDIEHVDGMKIIPLHTRELRTIIEKNISYAQLYDIFEEAYVSNDIVSPPEWYNTCVKAEIDVL